MCKRIIVGALLGLIALIDLNSTLAQINFFRTAKRLGFRSTKEVNVLWNDRYRIRLDVQRVLEKSAKGLPNVKSTRYLEQGADGGLNMMLNIFFPDRDARRFISFFQIDPEKNVDIDYFASQSLLNQMHRIRTRRNPWNQIVFEGDSAELQHELVSASLVDVVFGRGFLPKNVIGARFLSDIDAGARFYPHVQRSQAMAGRKILSYARNKTIGYHLQGRPPDRRALEAAANFLHTSPAISQPASAYGSSQTIDQAIKILMP